MRIKEQETRLTLQQHDNDDDDDDDDDDDICSLIPSFAIRIWFHADVCSVSDNFFSAGCFTLFYTIVATIVIIIIIIIMG